MNITIHYSSASQEWETPAELFDKYDSIYNFTLDVAASVTNAKCARFFSIDNDGLKNDWNGVIWCNPPYRNVKLWIKKAYEESIKGATVVMLIPARPDTKAWHEYVFKYAKIEFLRGRLKFSNSKNSAPFPSAIVIFNGQ